MADPVFFETGYIMLGSTIFDVEEISINATRDVNPYYVSGQKDPLTIRSGRKKVEFTFKRAFSDGILAKIYESDCEFTLLLFNNDPDTPQEVMAVTKCKLSQDNIGPINGQDVVREDIQGQGTSRKISIDEIQELTRKECTL